MLSGVGVLHGLFRRDSAAVVGEFLTFNWNRDPRGVLA
jgi:hypothetical protein